MYYFYAIPAGTVPGARLVLVLGEVLGGARAHLERRQNRVAGGVAVRGLVVANFAWLWPILNGEPITQEHWQAELWLPSWR